MKTWPRRLMAPLVALPVVLTLAAWTPRQAATWLQARELWMSDHDRPDALYLVAGARDQFRRIGAIGAFLNAAPPVAPAAGAGSADARRPASILIGCDDRNLLWSSDDRRDLTRTEWAHKLTSRLVEDANDRFPASGPVVLEGRHHGTDGEMQVLASYLSTRPDIRRLAVVTSPFHARRVVRRLRAHAGSRLDIGVLIPPPERQDRHPWIVALELGKMLRDALRTLPWPLRQDGLVPCTWTRPVNDSPAEPGA